MSITDNRSLFETILIAARLQHVSDVHLSSGMPIMIRRHCRLERRALFRIMSEPFVGSC